MKVGKKCWNCSGKMELRRGTYEEGIDYDYFKCVKCGDEILTMGQLNELAEKEKISRTVKISKWGSALAIRIPKQITKTYHITSGKQVTIIPEKTGFRVIPRKS